MTPRTAAKTEPAPGATPVRGDPRPSAAERLALLRRVHVFPVRHHSPRSSAALEAFLNEIKPRAILVEGPEDATSLLDVLVDAGTRPPVAILGYRTDGTPGSSLWPFASYSPEYVAIRWGSLQKANVAFIDIPIGCSLIASSLEEPDAPEDPASELCVSLDVAAACAAARGFRSFEEFWEASFEAPAYAPAAFREALLGYAELVRLSQRQPLHRARDAFMARRILSWLAPAGQASGGEFAPEEVVVVVGAAHAAAFAAGDVDFSLADHLPTPIPCAATLIPFSFPRLAEQLGYGAGNRAPQYYQRAHDAGCSFRRATLEVLVEFTEHLRLRGFFVSLADTIEAYRLAMALAAHRGKAEPGLDEVREATIATMCQGDATHVDGFLWPIMIGRHVGRVADRIGENSLQEEFTRQVEQRSLPHDDEPRAFVLKLKEPIQVQTSIFLHRLRVAEVPYASYIGKQVGRRGGQGVKAAQQEKAGEIDALTRVSEAWEAWWTPATNLALVEKVVLGNTLEAVATRVLEERLGAARGAGEAADVLLEAVVADCHDTVRSAVAACEKLAAADFDLPSLARATSVLSGLAVYGSSRALAAHGDQAILTLAEKTFERAVLRVGAACIGNEEAVQQPKEALRVLHGVAIARPWVDREGWFAAARALSASYVANPSAAGLATGLLYLAQVIEDDEVSRTVAQRLSNTLDPAGAAGFLQGFLEVNALALVKSRPVVAALDAFLTGIDKERFRDALPVLRRALASLGPTERRYLLENVLALRKLGDKAREAEAVLYEKDKDKLKAMSADLAQTMDDLDDLL